MQLIAPIPTLDRNNTQNDKHTRTARNKQTGLLQYHTHLYTLLLFPYSNITKKYKLKPSYMVIIIIIAQFSSHKRKFK